MAKFSDFITYFENLAVLHVAIQHSDTQKHFFRMELDEVLAGLNRQDVNFPMLVLEGYSFNFTDNRSDNVLKNRQGAFILMDHIKDITDYSLLHETWDSLESIGDDFLARIKADKRNPLTPVVRSFDFSSVEAHLIMNEIGNTVGIRYQYTITSAAPQTVNKNKWLIPETETNEQAGE